MSEQWKLGRFDFLPFHPAASHINPDYRDGWNHCFKAAEQLRQENKTLRGALELFNTCVVCAASLMPEFAPPHCPDCFVTDEVADKFEDDARQARAALAPPASGGGANAEHHARPEAKRKDVV